MKFLFSTFGFMSQYNSYHSAVKTSYTLGIENQVLPDDFTSATPRSTTYDWNHNLNPKDFVGSEFPNQIEEDI